MLLYGDYFIFCFCNLIRFCYYCYCSCFGIASVCVCFFFLFSLSLSLSLSFLCSVWLARKCGNGKHEKTTVSDRGEFFSRKLDWVIWTVCLVAGYGIERIVQICVWFFSTFRHFLGNQTRCLYASEMNF